MKEANGQGAAVIGDAHIPAAPYASIHLRVDDTSNDEVFLIASKLGQWRIARAVLPAKREMQQEVEAVVDFEACKLPARRFSDTAKLCDKLPLQCKNID